MKRGKRRAGPPPRRLATTVSRKLSHSTVSPRALPPRVKAPRPPVRHPIARPAVQAARSRPPSGRKVARIIDPDESSLLDVIDNLLNKGVVLNADLILALANVDLVYIRLSALLCAADRVMDVKR